jgi:3-hydroxyacyl-[acyl-carrier-protein] dehydratase
MTDTPLFDLADILPVLPHRPPFLFVDRVMKLDPYRLIVAERALRPDEPQFQGHFPGQPIMPGVLVAEALAQASGLLLGLSDKLSQATPPLKPKMFFLATTNFKFTHPAAPGDVLILQAEADKNFGGLFRFNAEARAGRNIVASGSLTLALVNEQK